MAGAVGLSALKGAQAGAQEDQFDAFWRSMIMVGAGAILPLAFAPFNFAPLALLSLGLCYFLIRTTRDWRAAAFYGWLFGVGKYAVGASWIYVSIHEQGGASEALAAILVALFVVFMALFSAVFGLVFGLLRNGRLAVDSVAFVCAWVGMEWLLTWFLTGFPWLFAGYGVMDTWLGGYAPIGGVLLLSGTVAASAVAGVNLFSGRVRTGVMALSFLGLLWGGGLFVSRVDWVKPGQTRTVALVQGNIEQLTKWQAVNRIPILEKYAELTEPHWGTDLIIWPEAALTLFVSQAQPWIDRWQLKGQRTGTSLMFGLPDVHETPSASAAPLFENTAMVVGGRIRSLCEAPAGPVWGIRAVGSPAARANWFF